MRAAPPPGSIMPSPTGNSGTTEQLVLAGGKGLAQVKNFVLKQLSNPLEAAGFLHPNVTYLKIPFTIGSVHLFNYCECYGVRLVNREKFPPKWKSFFYLRNTKDDFGGPWKSTVTQTVWFPTWFKISFFVLHAKKQKQKTLHTGLEWDEGEYFFPHEFSLLVIVKLLNDSTNQTLKCRM